MGNFKSNAFFTLFALVLATFQTNAQLNEFRSVVDKAFRDPRVELLLFFEYKGGDATFLDGHKLGLRGAFILPNQRVQEQFPGVLDYVGTSHATENFFFHNYVD